MLLRQFAMMIQGLFHFCQQVWKTIFHSRRQYQKVPESYKEVADDTTIYKFMPLEYLIYLLRHHQLRVSKVDAWEDPYENFLLKQHLRSSSQPQVQTEDVRNAIFGQSWTLCEDSDAMWRIYSQWNCHDLLPNRCAVRIRLKVKNLRSAVEQWSEQNSPDSPCYIREVSYCPQQDIDRWLNGLNLNIQDLSKHIVESQFMKRDTFIHEKEVRLLYAVDSTSSLCKRPFLEIPINPDLLIDEYCLDPRLTPEQDKMVQYVLEHYGVKKTSIVKSALYQMNPHTITIH